MDSLDGIRMTANLRPEDLAELRALASQLEGDLDALSQAQRAGVIRRIRAGLIAAGVTFSAEDERISSLWVTGSLGVGELIHQFGERLSRLGGSGANAI